MKNVTIGPHDAVIAVDLFQKAFRFGGGLPIVGGDGLVIPAINFISLPWGYVVASIDQHQLGNISFASSYRNVPVPKIGYPEITLEMVRKNWADYYVGPAAKFTAKQLVDYLENVVSCSQVLWPNHGTVEAGDGVISPPFIEVSLDYILFKGTDVLCDSYSAFVDNLGRPTGLADELRRCGIKRVFLIGLAFDYCVGWSALDGVKESFEVYIVENLTKSVGFPANSVEAMREQLLATGVKIITTADISTM
ncbi:MAG: isochorismatase family protein [Patescibacteria group bacterium]|jgi:nicotinamidase/pyrazinamidase